MISLFDNNISNKIILSSALFAIVFHASLIPISSLIKIDKIEDTEPKIILELINGNSRISTGTSSIKL